MARNNKKGGKQPPPKAQPRAGSRKHKKMLASGPLSIENRLYKWMDHRGAYPQHGHPAPGVSSARVSDIVINYRFTLNSSGTNATCGFVFSPSQLGMKQTSTKVYLPGVGGSAGYVDAFPVFRAEATNAITPMTLSQVIGSGGISSSDIGHCQFLGAEASIHGTSTTLNAGGDAFVVDGSACSGMVGANFGATSGSTPALMTNYNQIMQSEVNSGEFLPDRQVHLYRWHPHGSHVSEWKEVTQDVGNASLNGSGIQAGQYLYGTSALREFMAEDGYTAGLFVNSADAATAYNVHLSLRYRFRAAGGIKTLTSDSTSPSTYVAVADPAQSARLSAAAGQLAQIAKTTGIAKVSRPPAASTTSPLLKALEAATGGAGVAGAMHMVGPSVQTGVGSAISRFAGKAGGLLESAAADMLEGAAVFI